jgi:plasmid stabilization system protein ParE
MRERFRTLFLLPAQHPHAGQANDLPGVRRLSASPYPYLVFNRVTGDVLLTMRLDRPARSGEPASACLATAGPTSPRRTGG